MTVVYSHAMSGQSQTVTEAKAAWRARKRAQGMRIMELWCFPEHRERIRRFAATLTRTKRRQGGDLP